MEKLSVIVPCYNEGNSINEFYNAVKKELKEEKISYELIMVDDGSSDDTLAKLKDIEEASDDVKIISFSRNFGKEAAMLAGLQSASGDVFGIIDADMQQEPSTLILMYKKLLDNKDYDCVCAYREGHNDESSNKAFVSGLFYKLFNKISDVKLLNGASDFRVFKKNVRDAIISLPEKRRFLKGIFSFAGFNTIFIPYTPLKRFSGKTKWSFKKLFWYACDGIFSFSSFPLKLAFITGIITLLVGIINFFFGHLGFKTIILFLSFLLFNIGLVAMYVLKIFEDTNGRPNYIIKEKLGFNKKAVK